MKDTKIVEYIWLDGNPEVTQIRSKTKVIFLPENPKIEDFPYWSFDGSSTYQAKGSDSDCTLKPVNFVRDPLLDGGDFLVLAEVLNPDGVTPHPTNARAKLRKILDSGGKKYDPWIGFEQEYTLFKKNIPLGWPEHGYPAPQGPYYCGVGSEQIFGRDLAIEHMHMCMEANLIYGGMNAEVMPSQWEFQMGYRGVKGENASAIQVADHTWIGRWLLHRISEEYDVHVSFENKPKKGDWNGAGIHSNFSTKEMRDPKTGKKAMADAVERLGKKHKEHLLVYGHGLEKRLTGLHETSSIKNFTVGEAHRGCSIRIPRLVLLQGHGYIEDRRPGANADPYLVAARLIATICDIDDSCI